MEVLDFSLREIEFERTDTLFGFFVTYKVRPDDDEVLKMLSEDYDSLMDLYFGILSIKDHIKNGTKFGQLSKKTLDLMFLAIQDDIEDSMVWLECNYNNIILMRYRIEKRQQYYYELLTLREKYAN